MVEVKIDWTEENLKEYCKFNLFGKSKHSIILLIVLAVVYIVLVTGCVVLYVALNFYQSLILAAMLTVFFGAGALFLRSVMNSIVKKAMEENKDSHFERVIVGEHSIMVCQGGKPIGELMWDKVTGIYFNNKAETVYLNASDDAVLILEKKNIINGSMEELSKIAKEKQREHTKS